MNLKKIFIWITLLSYAACMKNSGDQNIEDLIPDEEIEMVGKFFSVFESSVDKRIESMPKNGDDMMVGFIKSFMDSVRKELFMLVLCDPFKNRNRIYEIILEYFNDAVEMELDQRQADLGWFFEECDNYASKLSDVILVSADVALESINTTFNSFKTADKDGIYHPVDFYEDVKPSNSTALADDETKILNEMDKNRDSLRKSSPQPEHELSLAAKSILYYGIYPNDGLFSVAVSFLEYSSKIGLKNFDPRLILNSGSFEFNINRGDFQIFCHHHNIKNYQSLVTSPLYNGPPVSKSDKFKAKRSVLLALVRKNIDLIVNTMNSEETVHAIQKERPEAEGIFVEILVLKVIDEISDFCNQLDIGGSLAVALESTIESACQNCINEYQLGSEVTDALISTVSKVFMSFFNSPLALIKKCDIVEVWKTHYDPKCLDYKGTTYLSTPVKIPKKSVKIIKNAKKKKHFIHRAADIEEEFTSQSASPPSLRRIPSAFNDLKDLFVDKVENSKAFDKENMNSFDGGLSIFDEPILKPAPAPVYKYCADDVPDFPFEDPSAVIKDPEYIKSTFEYLSEHGDNSCFMLDKRITTFKEGLDAFLRESFYNCEVIKSLNEIIGESIHKVLDK